MEKVGEKLVTFLDHINYHREQLRKLEKEQQKSLDKKKFEKAKTILQKSIEKIDKILNNEIDDTYEHFLEYFDEGLYFKR